MKVGKYDSRFETEKLIEHIEDAKGWLDKASEYYKQANPVHAEMTLNLAQAEVKHVWELSRGRYVSKKQTSLPKRKFKNLVAVAASILVFFGLLFGFQRDNFHKYLTGVFERSEKKAILDSELKLASDNSQLNVDESAAVQKQPANSVKPVSHAAKDKIEPESEPDSSVAIAVETKQDRAKPENLQNPVRLRRASQFTIDEEALYIEASRSLRSGK
ncbi:MAG: hypothetical protein GX075_07825 [Firmicutes bacterium]|nr:hypothetical protein [Bacillota bacterium]